MDDDLCGSVRRWLQQHRIHAGVRVDTCGFGLQRLCPTDLAALRRHSAVESHVLGLEWRHAYPASPQQSAQCKHSCRLPPAQNALSLLACSTMMAIRSSMRRCPSRSRSADTMPIESEFSRVAALSVTTAILLPAQPSGSSNTTGSLIARSHGLDVVATEQFFARPTGSDGSLSASRARYIAGACASRRRMFPMPTDPGSPCRHQFPSTPPQA